MWSSFPRAAVAGPTARERGRILVKDARRRDDSKHKFNTTLLGHPPAESHTQRMNASQLKIKLHLEKVTRAIKTGKKHDVGRSSFARQAWNWKHNRVSSVGDVLWQIAVPRPPVFARGPLFFFFLSFFFSSSLLFIDLITQTHSSVSLLAPLCSFIPLFSCRHELLYQSWGQKGNGTETEQKQTHPSFWGSGQLAGG